jgi:hypothetical protein
MRLVNDGFGLLWQEQIFDEEIIDKNTFYKLSINIKFKFFMENSKCQNVKLAMARVV